MSNNKKSEATKKTMPSSPFARAVKILMSLDHDANRLSDICRSTGLNTSAVHRLLKTLKASGFVVQNPVNRQYYLGPLLIQLTNDAVRAHQLLITTAFDEMKYIRNLTGETVNLTIPFGTERVILVELPSKQAISFAAGAGQSAPLFSSAGGKVLLAQCPDDELKILMKNMDFKALTPSTITDKDILLRELDNIRKQGYATSFGEVIPGAGALAVPIKNYAILVGLGVYGPENRFSNIINHLKEIRESAVRISDKLLKFSEQTSEGTPLSLDISSKKSARPRTKNRLKATEKS